MSHVADREDRMLAYYIKLIEEQEKQGKAPAEPAEVVEAKKVTKPVEEEKPAGEAKRGRPRKEPPTTVSGDHETPRTVNGTRALEQAEAERIISTILERRPGRAEFSVPSEEGSSRKRKSDPEKVSPPRERRVTESSRSRDVLLPLSKETRVKDPPPMETIAVAEEVKRVEEEPRPRRRSTGPEVPVPLPVVSVVEHVKETVVVPEVAHVADVVMEEEVKVEEKPRNKPSSRSSKPKSETVRAKTSQRSTSKQPAPSAVPDVVEEVKSGFSLVAEKQWWHKPVALSVIEFEDELLSVIDNFEQRSARPEAGCSLAETLCSIRPRS